jgi:flagellin-like hook-associated protein FlgL
MNVRPTGAWIVSSVQRELALRLAGLARAQERAAAGLAILRPSDDPLGAASVLSYRRAIAGAERYRDVLAAGAATLEAASDAAQRASTALGEARALLVQGLSGALSSEDREALARAVEGLRAELVDVANTRFGEQNIFAGAAAGVAPFAAFTHGGVERIHYAGSSQDYRVLAGAETTLRTALAGDDVFAATDPSGLRLTTVTGLAAGASPSQGSGFLYVELRHDATTGALGAGLAFVAGASDTILGDHALVVDPLAGTVQLDNGSPLAIPQPGDPALADFVVTNEHGAELHLDFSAYTGAAFNGTVRGDGSISADGATFTPVSFTESDFELTDAALGAVLHLDLRSVGRAGVELATFAGTVNAFDVLRGLANDLDDVHGLASDERRERFAVWLEELERNQDALGVAQSELGALARRARDREAALSEQSLSLGARRSEIEDVDVTAAVLDLTRAEQALELARAASARVLQGSLLDFLR